MSGSIDLDDPNLSSDIRDSLTRGTRFYEIDHWSHLLTIYELCAGSVLVTTLDYTLTPSSAYQPDLPWPQGTHV